MSCTPHASDLIAAIRGRFTLHMMGGVTLSSSEIAALVRNLNTVHALAKNCEEEVRLLEERLRSGVQIPVRDHVDAKSAAILDAMRPESNVTRLPVVPRPVLVTDNDGGAA